MAKFFRTVLCVSFILTAGTPSFAQSWTDNWDETFYGIRHLHRHGKDADGHKQSIHVVFVNLADPRVKIRAAIGKDKWGGGLETVQGMASRHGAAVAVNADYWSKHGKYNFYRPESTLAIKGNCYKTNPGRSAIAFSSDLTRVEIGRFGPHGKNPDDDDPPADEFPEWIYNAVGAGPQFIYNGSKRWDETVYQTEKYGVKVNINDDVWFGSSAQYWDTKADPHTAAAITADGKTLILITCDGRGAGRASGLGVAKGIADLLLEFGAWEALKLDSGGSTTMYYNGDVTNVPSDGRERAVVDALLVMSERKSTSDKRGLATALVIDRSGSMKGEKLDKALEAARAYITTMNPDDMASVSVFSSNASTEIQIERQDQIMPGLDSALSKIGATNATNIGAGLSHGHSQLQNAAVKPNAKVALLLSDGKNNRGDWRSIVDKFKNQGWPIYTVGFGKDADEATLRMIAEITGGTYRFAETVDIVNVYQEISAHAQNKSVLLSVSEPLAPTGKLNYQVPVSDKAQVLNVFTNWQGSRLKTVLTPPSGGLITGENLSGNTGRYAEGRIFQMMEVNNPKPGQWKIEVSWAEPPSVTEQVNISVSEKSDIFANILGFRSQYALGEPVIINVQAAEIVGNRNKVSLRNTSIIAKVQKPGPEMVRLVQAQSTDWTMYKDVMLDITRDVSLFDDGAHDDYNRGDGIFGNTFIETDKNGAYLVTVIITGEKQNGERIEKILKGSFQVGPISQNPVTTSQTIQYMEKAQSHLDKIDDTTPYKEDTLSEPLKEIDRLKGEDPLDSINKLLKE